MNPSDVSQKPSSTAPNAPGFGSELNESTSAGNASGSVAGMSQSVKEATRNTVNQLKSTATDAAGRIREQAAGMVDERRTQVADRIDSYGNAVHRSAESLEGDDPNVAWLTHEAANRINQVAEYVRARDLNQLKEDAAGIARQHPVAFFGGMFVAGLVVGNLLKATQRTAPHVSTTYPEETYPHAENVPVTGVSLEEAWPTEPRAETL